MLVRARACGADLVFIANQVRYRPGGADVTTYGLFRVSKLPSGRLEVSAIDLPATVTDVFAGDGACYALANRPLSADRFEISIYRSPDARVWHRAIMTVQPAMARSAERMGGYYYLGLGCTPGQCTSLAGRLLRIREP